MMSKIKMLAVSAAVVIFLAAICTAMNNDTVIQVDEPTDLFTLDVPLKGLKSIYRGPSPVTFHSVQIYVDETIRNFTVHLKSMKERVATVSEKAVILPCIKHHEELSTLLVANISSNDSHYSPVSYTYTSMSTDTNARTVNMSDGNCYNISFSTTSIYLGYSNLEFYVSSTTKENTSSVEDLYIGRVLITSIRFPRMIDLAFVIMIRIFVAMATLGMGNDLNVATIKEHLKKPKAPIIGLVSQFTFMPLLSYSIIYIMGYKGGWALGLFAMGCSPGGGQSNMYSKLLNGDMSLSVTMTTLSTILSIAMIPFWLYTLGTTIPTDEEVGRIKIPFTSILMSLAILIGPLLIGALIRYKLPRVSKVIRKGLKVFFFCLILFFFSVGIYSNLYIYEGFNAKMVFTACLLPYGGYFFGALVAFICRMKWTIIKTISFETGMQNVGVCFLIIKSSLKAPDSDLAVIAPMAAMLMTSIPVMIATPIYLFRERILKKRKAKKDAEAAEDGDGSTSKEMNKLNEDSQESDNDHSSTDDKDELSTKINETNTSKNLESENLLT